MSIPDYQTFMLPLLRLLSDGKEHLVRDAIGTLADEFGVAEEERMQLLPSGVSTVVGSRVGWAKTYLHKAGLLILPARGIVQISDRGISVLKKNPPKIDLKLLRQFPEFVEFQTPRKDKDRIQPEPVVSGDATPEEALDTAYQKLRADLEAEILERIKAVSPAFFERLVVDVLVRMGYGGSRADAGQAVGRSRDGGIDGIIKEDRLGLDAIYIQAKKWDNPVGRPEVQRFAGALQGQRARKGVFITTSSFTREAEEYVRSIDSKVVLINGPLLAKLMIDQSVGVSTIGAYEIKKVDSDYFEET